MKAKPSRNGDDVVLEMTSRDEPLLQAASVIPFHLRDILIPVDFSECSRKALQYAIPLARQHGARVTLLYVIPSASYAIGENSALGYGALLDELRGNAAKELGKLVATNEGIEKDSIIRSGSPTVEIVEAARALPADLIVISTHGHTGMKHLFLGSVAEHVIRHAPCPVLVVRERERDFVSN